METLEERIAYLRECAAEDGVVPNEQSLAFASVLYGLLPSPALFLHDNGNFSIGAYPEGYSFNFEVVPTAGGSGAILKGALIRSN